jgi:hypothetical protein
MLEQHVESVRSAQRDVLTTAEAHAADVASRLVVAKKAWGAQLDDDDDDFVDDAPPAVWQSVQDT